MGITFGQVFKEVTKYNNNLNAIRSCFIVIIILLVINMAFTCTLGICMYHKLQPKTQTYTPVQYEFMEDMELPD